MAEIWRTSLNRIQQRFTALKSSGHQLHAVVTERRSPPHGWPSSRWQPSYPATPENLANARIKTHRSAHMGRGPLDAPLNIDWSSAGPGKVTGDTWRRDIDLFGSTGEAVPQFLPIAIDAWKIVDSLPLVKETIPYRRDVTGDPIDAESLWVMFVFKLAWKEIQGTSLRAKRFVREQSNALYTIDVRSLEMMQKNPAFFPPGSHFGQWIPKDDPTPDFIYSEFTDFAEASICAIDILVGHEMERTTTPADSIPETSPTPNIKPMVHLPDWVKRNNQNPRSKPLHPFAIHGRILPVRVKYTYPKDYGSAPPNEIGEVGDSSLAGKTDEQYGTAFDAQCPEYLFAGRDIEALKRWFPHGWNLPKLRGILLTEFNRRAEEIPELTWPDIISILETRNPIFAMPVEKEKESVRRHAAAEPNMTSNVAGAGKADEPMPRGADVSTRDKNTSHASDSRASVTANASMASRSIIIIKFCRIEAEQRSEDTNVKAVC
jgi:hypothetical protein